MQYIDYMMNQESYKPQNHGQFSIESVEKGKNVEILLKFMRHGERTEQGELTDYGRKITRQHVRQSGIRKEDFHVTKAYGSNAGRKGGQGFGRSLETADIYAHEIAGDEAFKARANKLLNYETLKTPIPYNHEGIYNSNLPENFEKLSDSEKAVAAKRAQAATVNYLFSLKTPEAEMYKKEIAGAFASIIEHYSRMSKRLKSRSKILLLQGSHGGMMEQLLQQALVRQDRDGNKTIGFKCVEDIGGEFDPSESYNVDIRTGETGELQQIIVSFDNPERPTAEKMYLDPDKLREITAYYKRLHQNDEITHGDNTE